MQVAKTFNLVNSFLSKETGIMRSNKKYFVSLFSFNYTLKLGMEDYLYNVYSNKIVKNG